MLWAKYTADVTDVRRLIDIDIEFRRDRYHVCVCDFNTAIGWCVS